MKKNAQKINRQIMYYFEKLNPVKKIEALDFIKWLWGGPAASEEFTPQELKKIETLKIQKGGRKFNNWEKARKFLENMK